MPASGGGGAPAPPDAPAVPSGAVSWCLCCSALIAVFLSDLGPKPKPRERAALKPLALLLSPHAPRVRGFGFGGAGVECGSVRGNKRRFNATSVQVRDGVRERKRERERERETPQRVKTSPTTASNTIYALRTHLAHLGKRARREFCSRSGT